MKLSNRITTMDASPVRKLVPFANNAKKAGKKVYHLNIGQPDIVTPKEFLEVYNNFDKKIIEYTNSHGEDELLAAIVNYFKKYNITFEKEDIIITTGGSEAIIFSIIATCDPGDELLIPEPFYANYNGFATSNSVKINPITTKAEDGFHLPSREVIENKITTKTKAIIFSNPGNPTGVVYTKDELDMIVDIASKYNLFIISDEVYREFVYDNHKYTSLGEYSKENDNIIIVDSVSKRFSACGARIGYIASKNQELMANILKLAQSRLSVATINQLAAAKLYSAPQTYLEEVYNEYRKRRDVLYDTISKMDNVICRKPEGSFYLIAKLPIKSAEDFIIWLLEKFDVDNETIMLSPVNGFYATPGLGNDEVRIAYMLNLDDMQKAVNIFKQGLAKYLETES